jgi:hypothetical protein
VLSHGEKVSERASDATNGLLPFGILYKLGVRSIEHNDKGIVDLGKGHLRLEAGSLPLRQCGSHYSTGYRDGGGYTTIATYLTHFKNSRELRTTNFMFSEKYAVTLQSQYRNQLHGR